MRGTTDNTEKRRNHGRHGIHRKQKRKRESQTVEQYQPAPALPF
jgi:hypothetical protein